MAFQVVAPVAVEQGFIAAVEVQLFDEALEAFGRDLQVRRMVIAGRLGAAKQSVENLKGRAVLDQLRRGQALDDPDRSIGERPGPGRRKQGAKQIVTGLALPVGQHGLGQAHAADDHGLIAIGAIGVVMQGHHIDLVGVEGQIACRCPATNGPGGFAVRAGKVGQMFAYVLHAGGVDTGCGHVGHRDANGTDRLARRAVLRVVDNAVTG
ncbi:hypothetical protein D3C76_1064560 [compost metagenome]